MDGAGLKSNQKATEYSHNVHATVKPMSLAFSGDFYYSIQHSWLGKTVENFLPIGPCVVPSISVRAIKQSGGFLLSANLVSPYSVTKVCGIFIMGILPTSSDKQSGAMVIAYIILL